MVAERERDGRERERRCDCYATVSGSCVEWCAGRGRRAVWRNGGLNRVRTALSCGKNSCYSYRRLLLSPAMRLTQEWLYRTRDVDLWLVWLAEHHLALYADDTAITATSRKPTLLVSYLESYLSDLQRWLNEWRIAIMSLRAPRQS